MPDEGVAALANERPRECRAVPNVKLHILQRRRALMNEKKIRLIKNARSARVMRYPTAGARIECSTGKASKVMPQILVRFRSLIRCRSSMWHFFNVRHVFCGACTGQGAPSLSPQA
jgi:hypothetical protein